MYFHSRQLAKTINTINNLWTYIVRMFLLYHIIMWASETLLQHSTSLRDENCSIHVFMYCICTCWCRAKSRLSSCVSSTLLPMFTEASKTWHRLWEGGRRKGEKNNNLKSVQWIYDVTIVNAIISNLWLKICINSTAEVQYIVTVRKRGLYCNWANNQLYLGNGQMET